MKFTIVLECDNAAFEGAAGGPEVCRILRQLAQDLDAMSYLGAPELNHPWTLHDVNGNRVGRCIRTGTATIEEDADHE
jgi:hypothetical protein